MRIAEVFKSIQGEGPWIGRWVTFIRTAGCFLHCSFCDTKDSWGDGYEISIEELVQRVNTRYVVITGGEPTEQAEELKQLIYELQVKKNCLVQLESNGLFDNYASLGCDVVVVSPKPLASYTFIPNGVDYLKYVVDENFTGEVAIPEEVRQRFDQHIYLQPQAPVTQKTYDRIFKLVEEDPRLRAGIQLHKVYGVR